MITWQMDGLEELKAALRALPAELTTEARALVEASASAAAAEIRDAYPERTGRLRGGVRVTHNVGGVDRYGVVAWVINRAPHAYLFEKGTQTRKTKLGATRGMMPPGRVFLPRAARHQVQLIARLVDMVRAHGLTVTGHAP